MHLALGTFVNCTIVCVAIEDEQVLAFIVLKPETRQCAQRRFELRRRSGEGDDLRSRWQRGRHALPTPTSTLGVHLKTGDCG